MRSILGAFLIAVFCVVSSAAAQISGKVEVIGFGGDYRPGCWTPMIVRVTPNGAPTGFYELRVWQHDLDGDLPYFSTRISLTGTAGEQPFWTYFIPEPIHDGLTSDNSTPTELAQRLRITLHDAAGKELAQVPIGSATMRSIEPDAANASARATRLVLMVGASAAPALAHYDPRVIVGIKEDLIGDRITPDRLPENVLGYDGVDAVVWLEGDPAILSAGGGLRFDALRDYVRRGGHLVVSTPAQWQQILGFGDMLPVDISGLEINNLQSPLREITSRVFFPSGSKDAPERNPWDRYRTAQTIAVATPHADAVVDEYSDRVANPEQPQDRTPWLVRHPYGFGCVSWVAQDLGSRELLDRANWGWPAVWEEVLGAESAPVVYPRPIDKRRYDAAPGAIEMGSVVLDAMNLTGRLTVLILITVLFFIIYWLVSGPGLFFWLKYKQRSTQNWFIFGAIALAATAVTLGLVKLVLRGKPELKHISLVRVDFDRTKPATVASRIGIYVPRDGPQKIELTATAASAAPPMITPFPIHPTLHHRADGDKYLFAAPREYRVAVPTDDAARTAETDVPFRTTMKRLEANWIGAIDDRIEGQAALQPSVNNQGYISGTLRNLTGKNLRNIYIAFRHQPPGGKPLDWMMYLYEWKAGDDLDLGKSFNPPPGKSTIEWTVDLDNHVRPNREHPVRGGFAQWMNLFAPELSPSSMGDAKSLKNFDTDATPAMPLLTFFNRMPLLENDTLAGSMEKRAELHRSGLREWDMSNALMAGKLVIVAQADDTAVPLPLSVAGDAVTGTGRTIYQFTLPLTPIPEKPTTQPSNEPTTKASN